MPQLGSGHGSGYPGRIDTRQLFVNGTPAAPDDATRLDSELANDALNAVINIEHALGANVQGSFGSLAARLQQFVPGGGITYALFPFTAQTIWAIPGTSHNLGANAVLVQVWDTSTPAQLMAPNTVAIDQTTYDVTLTFNTPQAGYAVLGLGSPSYSTPFTTVESSPDVFTYTVPAATHALGTVVYLVGVYTDADPLNVLNPGSMVIDPLTGDCTVTFLTATSGTLILSAMGPRYVTTFGALTTWSIPGMTHLLGSAALLVQLLDGTGAVIEANAVTIHPLTYDVTCTFLFAQSGTLLLARTDEISGMEFDIRDGGIVNSTAARVYSDDGGLNLQMGTGDSLAVRNRLGATVAFMNAGGALGMGTVSPAYHLHLMVDSAAKPATSTWTVASDARLKEVLGPFTEGLETLLALEAVRYRYNGLGGMPTDGREYVGFLAQAVQAIAPYMVQSYRGRLTPEGEETEILTLNIDALNYLLLNALKEVLALQTALTARMDTLEVAVAALQGAQS